MHLTLDHLVVAARTLTEGAAWIESRLGVAPAGGGQHVIMGTHNRLLDLGAGVYLEVIAVDPGAAPPRRPRWFSLDDPGMRARLERGPALIHWVAGTTDIVAATRALPAELGDVIPVSRGDYSWRITVAPDGSLPAGGILPSLIQWDSPRPAATLPDSGCRLELLELTFAGAATAFAALRSMMSEDEGIRAAEGEPGLMARIRTSRGSLVMLA